MVAIVGADLDGMPLFRRNRRLWAAIACSAMRSCGLRLEMQAADAGEIAAERADRENGGRRGGAPPQRRPPAGDRLAGDDAHEPFRQRLVEHAGKCPAQLGTIRLEAAAPRLHLGIGGKPGLEIRGLLRRQLAVQRHVDVAFGVVARVHRSTTLIMRRRDASSSRPRSSSRPLAILDISVPAGMPRMFAASA